MALFVRPATPDDHPMLAAIDVATWSPDASLLPEPPAVEAPFLGPSVPPMALLLVAEVDGVVAGYVMGDRDVPLPCNDHVFMLRGMAVDPVHQRRGVARRLLDAAAADLAARGGRRLRSRVLGTNTASLAAHAAAGFGIEGTLRGEFRIGDAYVDDVLLALMLTPRDA